MSLRSDLPQLLREIIVIGHEQNDLGWTATASSLCREAAGLVTNAIRNGDDVEVDEPREGVVVASMLAGRVRCVDARASAGMVRMEMDETVPQGEEDAGTVRTVLELRWPRSMYGSDVAVRSAQDMEALFIAGADVCHRAWCIARDEPLRPFISMIGAMDADMILHAPTPWSGPVVEDLGDDPAAVKALDKGMLATVASRMPNVLCPIVMRRQHLHKVVVGPMEIPMRHLHPQSAADAMRLLRDVATASGRPVLREPVLRIGHGGDREIDLRDRFEEGDDAIE